jgi:hypothetical protein
MRQVLMAKMPYSARNRVFAISFWSYPHANSLKPMANMEQYRPKPSVNTTLRTKYHPKPMANTPLRTKYHPKSMANTLLRAKYHPKPMAYTPLLIRIWV